MKIQQQLPHFIDEKALLVVTGKQGYELYAAGDGVVERFDSFNSKNDIEFDEERTLVKRSGGGETYGVYVADKENEMEDDLRKDFLSHLEERLRHLANTETFHKVFLFSPGYVLGEVEEKIPSQFRDKLVLAIKGNYVESHPFDLLKLAKEEPADKVKHYNA